MNRKPVTFSTAGIEWDTGIERLVRADCERDVRNALARYQRMDRAFFTPLIEDTGHGRSNLPSPTRRLASHES